MYDSYLPHVAPWCFTWAKLMELGLIEDLDSMWVIFPHLVIVEYCQHVSVGFVVWLSMPIY